MKKKKPKFSMALKKTIREKIASGQSVSSVCRDLGISPSTYYRWKGELASGGAPEAPVLEKTVMPQDGSTRIPARLSYILGVHTSLIGIPGMEGYMYIYVRDIVYCKGESSQTSIHLINRKRHLVNRVLKQCEDTLTQFGFCRIHKSYLVNLNHIRKYHRGDGRAVEMSDGTRLDVTPGYRENLLQSLCNL